MSALKKIPLATALIETFNETYTFEKLRKDIIAGTVVSLVALPLAMALAIAVHLPPQHGLYTAIVAGVITALFGGSRMQVSGPTAAFVVIVAPIVTEFGLRGIIWCQIIAGIILLALGISRLGRVINYMPYPVTTGFTAGIAVVIGTIALTDFMGLHTTGHADHWPEKVMAIFNALGTLNPATFAIGLISLLTMIYFPKVTGIKAIPSSIVGIGLATLLAIWGNQHGMDVDTIGSRFSYTDASGNTIQGVPPIAPSLHIPGLSHDPLFALPNFAELRQWMMPALVIAALAALESLLSATVADSMSGTKHNPNAELNGIGLGNIFSGLAAGIPATGAIARTATNINAGAISPFSAIVHGVLLVAYMLVLAPAIKYMPMTALSALLLVTAWRMSHAHQFIHVMRVAPKSDVAVLLTCFALTVIIDMVAGVMVGFTLATLMFLRRMIDATEVHISHENDHRNEKLPEGVLFFHPDGPLFFGTAEKAFGRSEFMTREAHTVVVDFSGVPMIDATGLNLLEQTLEDMVDDERTVYLCAPHHVMKRIQRKLSDNLKTKLIFADQCENILETLRQNTTSAQTQTA